MNEPVGTLHDRLIGLLGIEPLISLSLLSIGVYLFYRFFLKGLNSERHFNLKKQFRELLITYLIFTLAWATQFLAQREGSVLVPFFDYFGIATVLLGAIVFVRAIKILVNEYLFLNSMTAGVPVLLVNLVTLIISIFIAAWLSTSVFGVRWAPLLATSAIVSVVLGLALQETLGNLFAGVALQFDKPYEIGDWIELETGTGERIVGEVYEITWRATILYGVYEEVIVLPNRLVAQSEVANFSARKKPIYRGLNVVLDTDADEVQVKRILHQVLKDTDGVIQSQTHYVMLRELTEKGSLYRLFYPIVHYSRQYLIVDEILMKSQAEFKKANIAVTRLRVSVETSKHPSDPV
jgi:small-conductance mechanosensitive channel